MNVVWAIELPRRGADLRVPPAQVADTPPHHEVDVFTAAGVSENAFGGVTDDDVLGFALAAKMLFVELAQVHTGLLTCVDDSILAVEDGIELFVGRIAQGRWKPEANAIRGTSRTAIILVRCVRALHRRRCAVQEWSGCPAELDIDRA